MSTFPKIVSVDFGSLMIFGGGTIAYVSIKSLPEASKITTMNYGGQLIPATEQHKKTVQLQVIGFAAGGIFLAILGVALITYATNK